MKHLRAWRAAAIVLALTSGFFGVSAAQDLAPAAPPRPLPGTRPVPPPGIELPDGDRRALEEGLSALAQEVRRLRKDPQAAARLPDVEIFYQAVRIAVDHQELFDPADIARARKLLDAGAARAR